MSDVGTHFRHMSLSGSGSASEGPDVVSPGSIGTPLPPQGYFMPRQQYPPVCVFTESFFLHVDFCRALFLDNSLATLIIWLRMLVIIFSVRSTLNT